MSARRLFLYGLYFFLVFVLLAVVQFPGKKLAPYVAGRVSGLFQKVTLETSGIDLVFPFGIACENTRILLGDLPPVHPDTLEIHPIVQTLIAQHKDLRFNGNWLEGKFKGRITGYSPEDNRCKKMVLTVDGLKVEDLVYRGRHVTVKLSFRLSGSYIWQLQGQTSRYHGQVVLANVAAKVEAPVFKKMGIDTLQFSRINLEFTQKGKQILVKKLTAAGDVIAFDLSGRVVTGGNPLASPMNWNVSVKGNFHPQSAYMATFLRIPSIARIFKRDDSRRIPVQVLGPLKSLGVSL